MHARILRIWGERQAAYSSVFARERCDRRLWQETLDRLQRVKGVAGGCPIIHALFRNKILDTIALNSLVSVKARPLALDLSPPRTSGLPHPRRPCLFAAAAAARAFAIRNPGADAALFTLWHYKAGKDGSVRSGPPVSSPTQQTCWRKATG